MGYDWFTVFKFLPPILHAGIEEVLAVLRSNRADSVHREVLLMKMSTEPSSDLPETERLLYM